MSRPYRHRRGIWPLLALLLAAPVCEDPKPRTQIMVVLDADHADHPELIGHLVTPILDGTADFVLADRTRTAERGALSPQQVFGNWLATRLIARASGHRYRDMGPFRAVRWNALVALDMRDPTWGWNVEMQMKAALLDLPTTEVDVPYRRRRYGRSKISGTVRGVVTAGTKIIATILALWWRRRAIVAAGRLGTGTS